MSILLTKFKYFFSNYIDKIYNLTKKIIENLQNTMMGFNKNENMKDITFSLIQ